MRDDGYENVSKEVSSKDIGLGWLSGITEWSAPRAVSMKPHKHPHIELIFCLRGSLTYEIDGHGQATIGESAGLVIPANAVHVLKGGNDAPCQRLGLHISRKMSASRQYGVFTPGDFSRFHSVLSRMVAIPFRLDPKLLAPVKDLARLLRQSSLESCDRGLLRALCCTILYYVADRLSQPIAASTPQMMDEAVKFLERHYHEKITSEALVRHMGYGRTQLFLLFKQHTGLPPNEYLVRLRIRKAKELLATTHKPLAAIANATGFSSTNYFKSVFLKYEGRLPSGT